jgi:hypothetical protein
VANDRLFYCGKPKRHSMNLQVITPGNDALWVPGTLPG